MVTGAIVGATSTATNFVTDLTEATNDHYIGGMIVFTSGTLAGQRLRILDYVGASKTVIVTAQTADVPAAGDTFTIS